MESSNDLPGQDKRNRAAKITFDHPIVSLPTLGRRFLGSHHLLGLASQSSKRSEPSRGLLTGVRD
jgi:hypothetical protein